MDHDAPKEISFKVAFLLQMIELIFDALQIFLTLNELFVDFYDLFLQE